MAETGEPNPLIIAVALKCDKRELRPREPISPWHFAIFINNTGECFCYGRNGMCNGHIPLITSLRSVDLFTRTQLDRETASHRSHRSSPWMTTQHASSGCYTLSNDTLVMNSFVAESEWNGVRSISTQLSSLVVQSDGPLKGSDDRCHIRLNRTTNH